MGLCCALAHLRRPPNFNSQVRTINWMNKLNWNRFCFVFACSSILRIFPSFVDLRVSNRFLVLLNSHVSRFLVTSIIFFKFSAKRLYFHLQTPIERHVIKDDNFGETERNVERVVRVGEEKSRKTKKCIRRHQPRHCAIHVYLEDDSNERAFAWRFMESFLSTYIWLTRSNLTGAYIRVECKYDRHRRNVYAGHSQCSGNVIKILGRPKTVASLLFNVSIYVSLSFDSPVLAS